MAKYTNTGGAVLQRLYAAGRGVSVSLSSIPPMTTTFTPTTSWPRLRRRCSAGTATLTVDGLLAAAEKFVLGLPEATKTEVGSSSVDVSHYGDAMETLCRHWLCRAL